MPATACPGGRGRRRRCAVRPPVRHAPVAAHGAARRTACRGPLLERSTSSSPKSPRASRSGPPQRTPQLPQRHRVDPADRTGHQRQRPLPVETVRRRLQHGQQSPHRRLVGQRLIGVGHIDRHTGGGQRAGERRAQPRNRADDHRHLRPRHAVDEMGASQRIGDQRGLGVRRGGDPHATASPGPSVPVNSPGRVGAGQPACDARDGGGHGRCAAVRFGQRERRAVTAQQRRDRLRGNRTPSGWGRRRSR